MSLQAPADWLVGDSEMGALMRSIDWAATPLGPVSAWPESLRSAVSICLGSRFPIVLYWGADYVVLYNDAYAEILGEKHPWALGRLCREVWSEIWDVIAPMLHGVTATGDATWSDDQLLILGRHGYPEECYFSFSFSPVRGTAGGVEGIFTAVIENTRRVLGERRLRALRDLGAAAVEAKSAEETCRIAAEILARHRADVPFALLYLLDADGTAASLVATVGLERGTPASPESFDPGGMDATGWPLATVCSTRQIQIVRDVTIGFDPLPGGPWPECPSSALVLPIASPGQEHLAGVLVAGVSPRRALDDEYRGFFELVAGQVAAAIADARAYEAERRRAEALAEIDRAKTAFFSNVSHEFRTPLTLMLGPVEDILAKPAEQGRPENRELLEVVQRNGLRLQKLVNTLLDFSRIEAGRHQAVFEPTDLGALTAELASHFRSACERAGLRLVTDCPPIGQPVYVDRDMWEKVVLNLVSNAFKHTFEGEIVVAVRAGASAVELSVRDTGTGIPPDEVPHIFERFYRVKSVRARTHEGTGIGLALVQELVKLHGGVLQVSSVLDKGSTFLVSIPTGTAHLPADLIGGPRTPVSATLGAGPYVEESLRWLPDSSPRPPSGPELGGALSSPSHAPSAHGEAAGSRARILWADDNADMRDYVGRLLSQHWTVEAVRDGQAALEAVRARRPDLVLTDVMMPRLDGFDLLRALRADPGTRSIPVILVSARAGEESRVEGLEAGADDYLVKPFSARELIAHVSARLELARVRQEMVDREQAARRQAEHANRAKDEFLAMLGHELRNPLGAIGGAVSVLGLLGEGGEETAKTREIIRRQAAHLTRLLDDLLDVARLDTGKIELQRRPLDLHVVAERALGSLAEGGKAAQHAIAVTGQTLWVDGDPTRLEQVIFNLLDNAVKYTPPGGRITLTMEAEGNFAVLRVVDTGSGMSPDVLSRAFEPFMQADPTLDRARGGLGLGLTLVRRLVELHGGAVDAHSPGLGHGTEVLVRLPLTDARPEPEEAPPSEVGIRPRRVLVIDDNSDMRTTLRLLLQLGGHHVDEAADGVGGLEMLLSLRPDVAFIDLGLPGRDGYELARAVRNAPRGESLYLVALTGYGQPQDRRRALEVGFDAYLVKPVYQDDLARVLAAAPAER